MTSKPSRRHSGNFHTQQTGHLRANQAGLSVVELLIVVMITLILAAFAIPTLLNSIQVADLRGAASDYSGLLEEARNSAIRDNSFYATYILAPAAGTKAALAYVDITKNGGTGVVTGDPTITIESDVTLEPVGSAPNTANLKSLLLPATTPVTPTDTSATPATFGPRGLPCTPLALTGGGGTVCDNSGGATAYWTFLENIKTGSWQAVTVTPAGRIKKWFYNGTAWAKL